jgi:class 3 adenylate cyclase
MEQSEYSAIRNEDGQLVGALRSADGAKIPLDDKQLGAWIEGQPQGNWAEYVVPAEGHVFQEIEDLIRYCKEAGILLCANGQASGAARLAYSSAATYHEHGYLMRLERAVAGGEGSTSADGLAGVSSNVWVTRKLYHQFDSELLDEKGTVRRLSTWPIRRSFVYIDVSDFSQYRGGEQALIITSLVSIVFNRSYWNNPFAAFGRCDLEAMLCIGDGYIFVFRDSLAATCFAAWLAELVELLVARKGVPIEFHFRIGVHVGPVLCFWDWGRGVQVGTDETYGYSGGDWNYIGDGINGGQRVLAAIGKETDDVLFLSGEVRQELLARDDGSDPCRKVLNSLRNKGRRADKHGKLWRVYEVNHSDLCGSECTGCVMP